MNDNKKFWQRFAFLYGRFMKSSEGMYEEIAEKAKPYLNRERNVLELACGSGQLSFRMCKSVKRWEATDFSENMIGEAKKRPRPKNLHFSVQDATNLPYTDESFDAVVIANALHIMPEPDRAMAEIARVLKKDGVLIAPTFVHGEGAGFAIRSGFLSFFGFKTFSKWTAEEFKAYIEAKEYTVSEHSVIGSKVAPLCCLIARKGE